jgi:hypothetical protein
MLLESKKMSKTTETSSTSITFFGELTIAFIVLKLCHVINWSWFWVLSPIITPLIIMIIVFFAILIYLYIARKYTIWKNFKKFDK